MARYRLRFLLQEFDLPLGDTLIGRSPECHVTIEDPLVSRQHARIRVRADGVVLEDLGSRNGSRLNGVPVRTPQPLKDGDRVRIGTQELVFCQVATLPVAPTKRTGFLRHCARCHNPYPEELVSCPVCGSSERMDEETLSGLYGEGRQNWSLQLLVEVLDKAVAMRREADADRIVRRAMSNIDEWISSAQPIDQAQMDAVADVMSRLACLQQSARVAVWVIEAYARARLAPPPALGERLAALPAAEIELLRGPIDGLLEGVRARGGTLDHDELEGLKRLEALRDSAGAPGR